MVTFYFDLATKRQLEIIKTGLDHISGAVWEELGKVPYNIYSKSGKPTQIFLIRHEDTKLLKGFENKELILHSGIFFGYLKDKEFFLSLEGAEYLFLELNENKDLLLKKIALNSEASKSFLYGNAIRPRDFLRKPEEMNRKDLIFVLNPKNEFLGIGYIFKKIQPRTSGDDYDKGSGKNKWTSYNRFDTGEQMELRNLIDYGYYIRRGY